MARIKSSEDPRLARLTEIALALPEATRQIYASHAQFLVRKKTFAYFLDNHHGDGIVAVTCKVLPGDNKALAEAQPFRRRHRQSYLRWLTPDYCFGPLRRPLIGIVLQFRSVT